MKKSKQLALIFLTLVGISMLYPEAAQASDLTNSGAANIPIPQEIGKLINAEEQLNDKCRDGSGDDPATQKACDERDKSFKNLSSLGWCYGRPDQAEYQKEWQKCGQSSGQAGAAAPSTIPTPVVLPACDNGLTVKVLKKAVEAAGLELIDVGSFQQYAESAEMRQCGASGPVSSGQQAMISYSVLQNSTKTGWYVNVSILLSGELTSDRITGSAAP